MTSATFGRPLNIGEISSGLRGLLIDATRLGYSLHLYAEDYMLVGQQATTREEWAFRGNYFQRLVCLANRFEQSAEEES